MEISKEDNQKKAKVSEAALYKTIFDCSLAGFFILDAKGTILKVNECSERMFGYERGALVSKNFEIIFPKDLSQDIHLLMKKPTSDPVQMVGLHSNGTGFEMDIRLVKAFVEGQTIYSVYCKQVDRAVFESDRKLRTLVKNVPGIVYRCATDFQWTMEFISNACTTISGYTPEEFYSTGTMNWGKLIHPEDKDKVEITRRKAILKKKRYELSYRILTACNETKWIWEKGSCVNDSIGNNSYLEGFMQDITERVNTKNLLAKEKEMLWKYLDTAASIFLIINKDQSIKLVNQKFCEILGYSRDEIIGKNWFHSYIPKNGKKELAQLFEQIMDGAIEPPSEFENWVVAKGAKRKLIHWRSAVLKDENGLITGLISSGVDVTDEIVTQQKLKESEEKNRAILNAIPDIMTVHDDQGKMLEMHIPGRSNFIQSREKPVSINITNPLPLEVEQKISEITTKVLRRKRIKTMEITAAVEQDEFDYECRIVPLSKKRVLTIVRNITETKAIQKTLHLRNRALESAGNGIIIVDAQQTDLPIIYSNAAFSRITGYGKSEILGKNCRFLQGDDLDQKEIQSLAIAIQKRKSCRVVLRNYRKDGALFFNELIINPLYDEKQRLTHFIGVQNDVTEIQKTKMQLEDYADKLELKVAERTKEIEATVQRLVENNLMLQDQIQETILAESNALRSEAQFTAIAKKFPNGLIVVFNAFFEILYIEGEELKRSKMKKNDLEGSYIDEVSLFTTFQLEQIKQDIQKTISGKSLSFEMEFENNTYAVNSTPLTLDAESTTWALFVYNNITEQKKVQDKLAKALKAEQELNELKSRFISMASHEFRTPLSAILSSAILIGKQNKSGMEEHRKKHVDRIRTHVKHLVVILNDFLSLSKLEEGMVQAKGQYFELIQFCKLVIDEMETTKKKGQKIQFKNKDSILPVFLDPKLMSHIIINLLSNALKYSEEGKIISFEVQQTVETIKLIFSDQGMGIPEEEQKRLFERFFRADNATNIQGTGLGLHIVKQYTDLMGGTISFTSKLGEGSTFTVQLPKNLYEHEKNIID